MRKKIIQTAVLAGVFFTALPSMAVYQVGDFVDTDFTLPAVQGGNVSLSDYNGELVLVNFFYTT